MGAVPYKNGGVRRGKLSSAQSVRKQLFVGTGVLDGPLRSLYAVLTAIKRGGALAASLKNLRVPAFYRNIICLNHFLIRKYYLSCAFQGGEKMKPIFRSSPQAAPSKNSLHFFIDATGFRRLRTAGVSRSAEREEGFTPSTRASF